MFCPEISFPLTLNAESNPYPLTSVVSRPSIYAENVDLEKNTASKNRLHKSTLEIFLNMVTSNFLN
jgi:hypothetical protein